MDAAETTRQIASFTGLDDETVSSQLLPYLNGLSDANAVRHHLADLLGPGQPQASFTQRYIDARWPPSKAPPVSAIKADNKQALKPASTSQNAPQASSSRSSAAPSPVPLSTPPAPAFELIPTDTIKTLDADLAALMGSSSSTAQPRPRACFCRALRHPPAARLPLCNSCGLIQCCLNQPPSLWPGAACPSCNQLLLGDEAKRAGLVAELSDERDKAYKAEERRVEELRAARARDKAQRGGGAGQSVDVFPELGGGVQSRARQQRDNVNAAMGRTGGSMRSQASGSATPTSATRQARVLTIGKKGKVTYGSANKKPKKKVVETVASPGKLQQQEEAVEEAVQEVSQDDEEEREQEEMQRLGFVVDPDDDGLRDGDADDDEPRDLIVPARPHGIEVQYVPLDDRPSPPEDPDEEEDEAEPAPTQAAAAASSSSSSTRVPGSAQNKATKAGKRGGKGAAART